MTCELCGGDWVVQAAAVSVSGPDWSHPVEIPCPLCLCRLELM